MRKLIKLGLITFAILLTIWGVDIAAKQSASNQLTQQRPEGPTAGVILGHVYRDGKFSTRSLKRLNKGHELFANGTVDYLVTTGGKLPRFNDDEASMGALAKTYLIESGIPADKILVEGDSKNTYENASGALVAIQESGILIENIVVITSADHISRSMLIFAEAFGDSYQIFPAISDYYAGYWSFKDFTWHIGAWGKFFVLQVI